MLPLQLPAPWQRASTALLQRSSDTQALAALVARARPLLVITESAWQAQRLPQEIPFFAPQLRVHVLPEAASGNARGAIQRSFRQTVTHADPRSA